MSNTPEKFPRNDAAEDISATDPDFQTAVGFDDGAGESSEPKIRQLTTGVAESTTQQPPGIDARTIPEQVTARVAHSPDSVAYWVPNGQDLPYRGEFDQPAQRSGPSESAAPAEPSLKSITWAEFHRRIQHVAAGLVVHGVAKGDAIGVMSETRLDWLVVDVAAQSIGAKVTALYPSSPVGDISWIINDSGLRTLFVEDLATLQKVEQVREETSLELQFYVMEPQYQGADSLSALAAAGATHLKAQPDAVSRLAAEISPEDTSSLVYTSGTSGIPKGVRLTHANWLAETMTVEALDILGPADVQMMWLPLSHVFSRTFAYAQFRLGYASIVDGEVPRLMSNLAQGKPTFMPSVPRTFEKIYAGIQDLAKSKGVAAVALSNWAKRIGTRWSRAQQIGRKPSLLTSILYPLADRILFRKVRAKLGGRMRYFVSGSAPLSVEILEFFHMSRVMILEGYGLTETSAAVTVNRPDDFYFGTAGPALAGQTIAIAEDGEILVAVSGGVTTPGYLNNPEATDELIKDGWLYTGDIGELIDGRYVHITDRKRDMFKTSNGKYVAPARVEATLGATSALIGQALLHGEDRPYCVALISVDSEELQRWAAAKALIGSYAELLKHPELSKEIQKVIDRANTALPRWEQIKKFAVLPRELSVDTADITASLKLRRQAVLARYQQIIHTLYSAA